MSAPPTPKASSQAIKPAAQDDAAEEKVSRALAYVAALRELPPLGPVRGRVITRDEMVTRVERELNDEIPPGVVSASGDILFALGVVPADFDYRRGLLEMMRAELLGFYEPREKTMFIGGDLRGQELDATLWHELVHALQDQHYGLQKLLDFSPDAGDWQAAVHALAEGDATSAMLDALFADKGLRAPDISDAMLNLQGALSVGAVERVPTIVKRSLIAPYLDGLSFVNALRRRGGWQAVDAAWERLPASTEQLLHLEKYDAREKPEALPSLAVPGASQLTYSDVYGEETLRILFQEWMPARAAVLAASGWAGDRVAVFALAGQAQVGWRIRYDTAAAARLGMQAFTRGALLAEGQSSDAHGQPELVAAATAEREARPGYVCRERHTRGPFAVLHRDRELAVVLGPFLRNSSGAVSEGDCSKAIAWAAQLLASSKP